MRVDGRTACREGGRTLGGRGDDQKQRMDEVEDGFFQEVYSRSSFFCSALHRVVDRARQTFAWKVTKGGATNNQVGLQQSARCGQTLLYAEVSQELDTIQDPPQATLGRMDINIVASTQSLTSAQLRLVGRNRNCYCRSCLCHMFQNKHSPREDHHFPDLRTHGSLR